MPTTGQARRRDGDKMVRSHSRSEDLLQSSDKERERLSEDSGEERHRRKEKRSSGGRSPSRSRSRERRHKSRSREKRRSRSRSHERRSKSRERKRRPKSRSRSHSRHRQRSKSRSKSREKKKRTEKVKKITLSRSPSPVAFRGRNTAMDAQEALARRLERAKKLQEQKEKELLEKHQQQQQEIVAAAAVAATPLLCENAPAAASGPALNVAALLASGTQVTPQIAMAAQMAALQAKTLAETGIAVPSYYNPSAVNPLKFAEQEKKRKLLWQGKKEGDKSQTAELWEKLNFGNKDQNVKFRKLMGIKADEEASSGDIKEEDMKTLQQQEEMFRNLDVQYEMARSQTHTQRGMGLGFSTSFSSRGMDPV
ncbi:arginine/serine-rich coiled-coil protein 2 isoform X3 [Clarias gariepinus]|uniref:arginine/serine-rich coiled-coil protein 2 isoform X3 n=1 Tax=Clarias gariepinus TaxID=13013 RepID=UPI00234DAF8A|nr:arginine/serine-rich coiled-coil protein 2 isoform X3 [Clarias gariepinus]XP_053337182.1 arginine/serine-rich coiled-coil protein 2 isoform X3 [Clarias gariepinus]